MSSRTFTIAVFGVAIAIAGLLSFYASGHPDGLMFVAESHGFASTQTDSLTRGWPLAGYAVEGLANARLSGGIAGTAGCVACFTLVAAVTRQRSGSRSNG